MLTKEFVSLCESYAAKKSDVICVNIEDSKKLCKYIVEFNSYILEFRYVKKESVYVKPSSLYCVLKLRKNSVVHYHLTDIIPFLKNRSFKSCYFWSIESAERLSSCFNSLERIIDNILSQLEPILSDDSALENDLFDSYRMIYSLKPNDIDFTKIENEKEYAHSYFLSLQKMRDEFVFLRYSSFPPYALLLNSKTDKALKKYNKLNQKNKLFEYEKLLVKYITESDVIVFNPFDTDSDITASDKFMSVKAIIKSGLACFTVFSVLFCGMFAVYNAVASADTVLFLASPWYTGFMCAGLCAVFGALAFFPYFSDKHLTKAQRQDYSKVLYSKNVKRFSFISFAVSVIVSVFFAVMIMMPTVRFYNDSISFDNLTYSYDEIDSVYYIEARYNEYGDRIDRSSYVILFGDKTSLDLDGYTSVGFTEEEILPLLKNKGISIRSADSERDLPWYSEPV